MWKELRQTIAPYLLSCLKYLECGSFIENTPSEVKILKSTTNYWQFFVDFGCLFRLNLDHKDLDHFPLLEGEEKLKLLTFKGNRIEKIENVVSLPNLIYLDLYDNQIKEIQNLHTVPTLRVLMIAKNNITRIRNLEAQVNLEVLDLHKNFISKIEGVKKLEHLR